ncbi:hypothetical protein SDC9_150949 [bioreactor metagenome]|uniref:Uncharacterized protein n=1 Tax=bioreactor metagenome TaxID=1076179 RepID=A0A645EPH8_9ZZZZ
MLVNLAALQNTLQLGRNLLVHQIPSGSAGHCDTGVPVGNYGDAAGGFIQGLTQLSRKIPQTAHQGILFENNAAILVGVYFQWIALSDAHGSANFLWNYHAAKIVDTANDSGCFHSFIPPAVVFATPLVSAGFYSLYRATDWIHLESSTAKKGGPTGWGKRSGTKICLFYGGGIEQLLAGAADGHDPVFQYAGLVTNGQRLFRVLLHQKNGNT